MWSKHHSLSKALAVMESLSGRLTKRHLEQLVFIISILSVILIAFIGLRTYLSQQLFNLALGMLAIPFVIQTCPGKKDSSRFAVIALLLMGLSFYAPVNTLVYLSLIAIVLFLVESRFGKINFLTIIVAIFTVPLSNYLVNTFSFPIRLWLTSICGNIFQTMGIPVITSGNTFSYAGNDFTVDPACMGLNMMVSSLLIGILIFGFYQKKYQKEMPVGIVLAYLTIVLLLNIFSNLVRMVILVLFQIFPDTIMHDMIGILCFLIQVILPAWGISWFMISKLKGNHNSKKVMSEHQRNPSLRLMIQIGCCAFLWITAFYVIAQKENDAIPALAEDISGYTVTSHSQGVAKLENSVSLIYVKQIRWFCDTEHNPMMCWTGSGYKMSQVKEDVLDGLTIYSGILQNEDDILYTAWWYSNGISSTNSQLHWRWDLFTGAPAYSLLNVTTADQNTLKTEVSKFATLFVHQQGSFREPH